MGFISHFGNTYNSKSKDEIKEVFLNEEIAVYEVIIMDNNLMKIDLFTLIKETL